MDFFHSGLHWLYIIHNKNHRPSLSDNICQPSAQECYQFMMGFMEEKEGICSDECHPGDIVPHELSGNPASVEVNMRSFRNWYRGYEQKRKSSLLFKSSELFVGASNNCGCQQFLHQRKYQIYLVWESNFQVLDKSMEKDTPSQHSSFLQKYLRVLSFPDWVNMGRHPLLGAPAASSGSTCLQTACRWCEIGSPHGSPWCWEEWIYLGNPSAWMCNPHIIWDFTMISDVNSSMIFGSTDWPEVAFGESGGILNWFHMFWNNIH